MAGRKRQRLRIVAVEPESPVERDPGPKDGVAAVLRAARVRRGLDLTEVAATLKIRRALLDAIEGGRFGDLPGSAYAVSFVRAYAEFLGLDAAEIVARFRDEAAHIDSRTELNFPRPPAESRVPGAVVVVISVLLAAAGYGLWYYTSIADRMAIPHVDIVPERLAALVERPTPPSSAQAEAATVPVPAAPESPPQTGSLDTITVVAPLPPSEVLQIAAATPVDATVPVDAAPQIAALPPPAEAPVLGTASAPTNDAASIPAPPAETAAAARVLGDTSGQSRVSLRATADSWIRVSDGGGNVLFMRILRAGDVYNVPNRSGLLLYTGNAGALDVRVDGKSAPPLGRHLQVRRDVALDPARLLAGSDG